jgi:vanillate/4-hydroxybenzoate decarboxylase subunit D
MICPRCDSEISEILVKAPIDSAWEVYKCNKCAYIWRSTESEDVTDPKKYDSRFKINPANIDELPVMPPIPKLEK